jgi:hypothetical protein
MTESEWLAQRSVEDAGVCARGVSETKLYLFAVACCRQVWRTTPVILQSGTGRFYSTSENVRFVLNARDCGMRPPGKRRRSVKSSATIPPWSMGPCLAGLGRRDDRKMARTIYDEQSFDRLPILADALEDAGCTDRAVLDHCRSSGSHVRGCWVLTLLEKE